MLRRFGVKMCGRRTEKSFGGRKELGTTSLIPGRNEDLCCIHPLLDVCVYGICMELF